MGVTSDLCFQEITLNAMGNEWLESNNGSRRPVPGVSWFRQEVIVAQATEVIMETKRIG